MQCLKCCRCGDGSGNNSVKTKTGRLRLATGTGNVQSIMHQASLKLGGPYEILITYLGHLVDITTSIASTLDKNL